MEAYLAAEKADAEAQGYTWVLAELPAELPEEEV